MQIFDIWYHFNKNFKLNTMPIIIKTKEETMRMRRRMKKRKRGRKEEPNINIVGPLSIYIQFIRI